MEARLMENEIQLRKCASCLGNLPYDQFGESVNSHDGYNPSCRGCRKTLAAKTYQNKKAGYPDRIEARSPLRLSNSSTLDLIVAGSLTSEFLLIGKGVNNELEYSVKLNFLSESWIATISEGQLQLRQLHSFPNIGWEGFKVMIGSQLFKLEIKLVSGGKVSSMKGNKKS